MFFSSVQRSQKSSRNFTPARGGGYQGSALVSNTQFMGPPWNPLEIPPREFPPITIQPISSLDDIRRIASFAEMARSASLHVCLNITAAEERMSLTLKKGNRKRLRSCCGLKTAARTSYALLSLACRLRRAEEHRLFGVRE